MCTRCCNFAELRFILVLSVITRRTKSRWRSWRHSGCPSVCAHFRMWSISRRLMCDLFHTARTHHIAFWVLLRLTKYLTYTSEPKWLRICWSSPISDSLTQIALFRSICAFWDYDLPPTFWPTSLQTSFGSNNLIFRAHLWKPLGDSFHIAHT